MTTHTDPQFELRTSAFRGNSIGMLTVQGSETSTTSLLTVIDEFEDLAPRKASVSLDERQWDALAVFAADRAKALRENAAKSDENTDEHMIGHDEIEAWREGFLARPSLSDRLRAFFQNNF